MSDRAESLKEEAGRDSTSQAKEVMTCGSSLVTPLGPDDNSSLNSVQKIFKACSKKSIPFVLAGAFGIILGFCALFGIGVSGLFSVSVLMPFSGSSTTSNFLLAWSEIISY